MAEVRPKIVHCQQLYEAPLCWSWLKLGITWPGFFSGRLIIVCLDVSAGQKRISLMLRLITVAVVIGKLRSPQTKLRHGLELLGRFHLLCPFRLPIFNMVFCR